MPHCTQTLNCKTIYKGRLSWKLESGIIWSPWRPSENLFWKHAQEMPFLKIRISLFDRRGLKTKWKPLFWAVFPPPVPLLFLYCWPPTFNLHIVVVWAALRVEGHHNERAVRCQCLSICLSRTLSHQGSGREGGHIHHHGGLCGGVEDAVETLKTFWARGHTGTF